MCFVRPRNAWLGGGNSSTTSRDAGRKEIRPFRQTDRPAPRGLTSSFAGSGFAARRAKRAKQICQRAKGITERSGARPWLVLPEEGAGQRDQGVAADAHILDPYVFFRTVQTRTARSEQHRGHTRSAQDRGVAPEAHPDAPRTAPS